MHHVILDINMVVRWDFERCLVDMQLGTVWHCGMPLRPDAAKIFKTKYGISYLTVHQRVMSCMSVAFATGFWCIGRHLRVCTPMISCTATTNSRKPCGHCSLDPAAVPRQINHRESSPSRARTSIPEQACAFRNQTTASSSKHGLSLLCMLYTLLYTSKIQRL